MAAADPAPPSPPARVRVVLADAARDRRAGQVRTELAEQSGVGEALVTGLMRAQLGLALRLAAVVAIGLGGLPLLFAVAPAVAEARLFGVPLPWILLGLVAYPFLFGVGATYVWLSERTEREFAELVDRKRS
jgi:hypothetical protein